MVSELPVPAILEGDLDAIAACLPALREAYVRQLEEAGFIDVRITDEKPYPTSFILSDPGVQEFVAAHPDHLDELTRFAASISGAHFEAVKA